ncbi:MAG: protein kinase [Myxococcota bacterium]
MRFVFQALLVALALPIGAGGGVGLRVSGNDETARETRTVVEGWLTKTGAVQPEQIAEGLDLISREKVAFGLLGVSFVLLIGAYRLRPTRSGLPGPKPASDPQKPIPVRVLRRLRKTAAAMEKEDGPLAAGDFLLTEGLQDEAIELFLRTGHFELAAEVLHDQNRFDESAQLYEKAGRLELAAPIYTQLERFADAARCYLKANKRSTAAEMFERAENFVEAGKCYRECGFHRHASNAFSRAGRKSDAVDSLVAVFREEGSGLLSQSPGRQQELREVARNAGKFLIELGRLEEAEEILVRASAWMEAADVALTSEAFERAADLFVRAGRPELAADALERAGEGQGAARLRGEYLRDQGEGAQAAELLEKAEEYASAGDLYRQLERYEEAAQCYQRAGSSDEAAEMYCAAEMPDAAATAYESAGKLAEAAQCASRAGDEARAATLLERAGRLFEAAEAYVAIDQADDAIRLFQQIEEGDGRFTEAATRLGELFRTKGMHTLSLKKFEQAIGEAAITRQTVEAHYNLAQALEDNGDWRQAIDAYERILTFDYHYRDVAERLEHSKASYENQGTKRATHAGAAAAAAESTGRYQLGKELGRGGMGVVYLARDAVLERDVAFKVLPEEVRSNANSLRAFLREAKAAAKLNHPNIVTVYDAGKSEHGFYLAMEYVEGSTLKQIVQRRGAIPLSGVLYVLRQMAEALAYAHRKKVVHRDIKSANTMWTASKKVKIMDFGLAKVLEEVRGQTTLVAGTPFYMSPEQTLGRQVDHRTDLYSLGVTIFELATSQLPFQQGNVPYHHVHTAPPDPREINQELPEFLCGIILRCLAKDPEERFARAEEILEALERSRRESPS